MNRRRFLRVSVKLGLLAGAAAFAGVFVSSLFVPGPASGDRIHLDGIPPGSARLATWEGGPVWLVHRSPAQLKALAQRSSSPATAAGNSPVANAWRSRVQEYGIYGAATTRSGVLVQYVHERPGRLAAGTPWHGGFIDPGSGAVFDAAGRRYGPAPGEPLAVPPHRYLGPATVELGGW